MALPALLLRAAALSGVLASCGGSGPPPARHEAPRAPIATREYLYFDGEATHWVALEGGAVREIAHRAGQVVSSGDTLRIVQARTRRIAARCNRGEPDATVDETLQLTDYALVDLESSERIDVAVGAPDDVASYCAFERRCADGYSVGPLFFTACCEYSDVGGAHGGSRCVDVAIDLVGGTPIDLRRTIAPSELDAAKARMGELVRADGNDASFLEGVDATNARVTRVVPHYDALGALEIDLQVTVDTCYACGFGDWDSYTGSVVIPSSTFPAELEPFRTLPRALVASAGLGVSFLDAEPARRAELLHVFTGIEASAGTP